MRHVQILVMALALMSLCGAMPDKDDNEGKSAQSTDRLSFNSNRNDRNRGNTFTDRRNIISRVTPQPHIFTGSTPSILGGTQLDSHFIPSGHRDQFGNPTLVHDPLFSHGNDINNVAILGRDPNYIIRNPEMLVLYPQLALHHRDLILQYPGLRHYVSPYVIQLISRRNNFVSPTFGSPTFGSPTFGSPNIRGVHFDNGGLGGIRTTFDQNLLNLRNPIDRPFLTTLSPINHNRSIRLNKK